MNKAELIEDLTKRSTYVIELDAHDPNEYEEEPEGAPDNAISTTITNFEGNLMLIAEIGIDEQGEGFVLVRCVDAHGEPVPPSVFDLGTSVMLHAAS